jgi:hypothetical protein
MSRDSYPEVILERAVEAFAQVWKEVRRYWQPRSWAQAQLVCMRTAGWEDVDYETIMTVSGFGPSFSYHPSGLWWAQYVPPQGCDRRIAQATGFGYEGIWCQTAEDYWQALKETIDDGKSVHAPYLEDMVLVGYREAHNRVDRKVKPLAPVGVEPDSWWTWRDFKEWFAEESHGFLGRHTARVQQAPLRQSATTVLETIEKLSHADSRAESPDWAGVRWGLDGLRAYASDVGDVSRSGVPDQYFYSGWMGCHAIYPQISGRTCTAVYLQRLGEAGVFHQEVNARILAAAQEYLAARAAWGEYERHLGNRVIAEVGNGWMIEERRLAGTAAIRQAIEHEEAAIAEVREALGAIR